MMKQENKEFLLKKFNIDINNYSEEELNKILDDLLQILNNAIKEKTDNINKLELEIMNEIAE